MISVDFKGKPFKEEDRDNVAAVLFRQGKQLESKSNYAILIQNGKVSVDFEGKPFKEEERDNISAALFRESNMHENKNNYAILIHAGKISVDFEGKPFEEEERYNIAAALYRQVNIPVARHNFLNLLLDDFINTTFEDDRVLDSEQDKYEYVIKFLESDVDVFSKESLLAFAKSKIIKTKEDYQETLELCEVSLAAGQNNGEELHNALNPPEADSMEESDDQEDTHAESPCKVKKNEEEPNLTVSEESPTTVQTRRQKKIIDQEDRKRKREEEANKKYEAFISLSELERNERFSKIVLKPITHEAEQPYDIEFKCDIEDIRKSSQFQKLVQAIKNRTNEGHPKILHDKRLKQGFLGQN